MKLWFAVALIALQVPAIAAGESVSDQANRPVLRIVFLTPADIEPPAGVKERMRQIVDYTQAFYGKWLKHWGYECERPLAVKRDKDGYPELLFVRGEYSKASGHYDKHGFQQEVVGAASRQYKISPKGAVWWIFVHGALEEGWGRGGGNFRRGGVSTAHYYPLPGQIKTTDDFAGGLPRDLMLKGAVHELGHALGLPHIGPKDCDEFGNSLMGPVNKAYAAQKGPDEKRVYLSEASAAMLWKHPLFSGVENDRDRIPQAQLLDFNAVYEKQEDRLVVTGKLKADYPAHGVVVANGSRKTRSPYWMKCFSGKVAQDGTFRVVLDELDHSDGQLRIVFCFNNGAVVGQDSKLGLNQGFAHSYRFRDGGFDFDVEPSAADSRLFRQQGKPAAPRPAAKQ